MNAYVIDLNDWSGHSIGQMGNDKVVIESDIPPTCEHMDITDKGTCFNQGVFDGKYGKAMTYATFCSIRIMLDVYGQANSYEELLQNKVDALEEALAEVYLNG